MLTRSESLKAQRQSAFAALRGRENGAQRSSVRLKTEYLWTSLRSRSLSYEDGWDGQDSFNVGAERDEKHIFSKVLCML
jgi:hypothetical protein